MSEELLDYHSLILSASFFPKRLRKPNAWIGHTPFAAWLIKQFAPKVFVELGTHSGNSYFSICQAIQETNLSTECFAVDTWAGDEHAGFYEKGIFSEVDSYNRDHYAKFSHLLRMTFDEANSHFANRTIDLLHIDGLHTYEAVKHDFETWLPKLAPDALVMFHDTNVYENEFGVWELWKELQQIYPRNIEFPHSHGLGVLQIDGDLPGNSLSWLNAGSPQQKELKIYFAQIGTRQTERFDLKSVNDLRDYIAEREEKIVKLYDAVNSRNFQIDALNETIKARNEKIVNLNEYLVNNAEQISDLNYVVKGQTLTGNHYRNLHAELTKTVEQYKNRLLNLEESFAESAALHEEQINLYQARVTAQREEVLREIQNTRTWRLTQPLRSAARIARRFRNKFSGDSQNIESGIQNSRQVLINLSPELSQAEDEIINLENKPVFHEHKTRNDEHQIAEIAAKYQLGTKSIALFVSHNRGEIEKQVSQSAQTLTENGSRALILRPENENSVVLELFGDDIQIKLETGDLELLAENLKNFEIKKAYIHHIAGFCFPVEQLLLLAQIPYDCTMSDSFFNLFQPDEREDFPVSLSCREEHFDSYLKHLKLLSLLNGSERVICPTTELAARVAEICPHVPIVVLSEAANDAESTKTNIDKFSEFEEHKFPEEKISDAPTLLIVPEAHGLVPSPCAYIRLIKPLLSKSIQQKFKLRLSDFKAVKSVRPDIVITNRLPCKEFSEVETFLTDIREVRAKLVYDIDDNLLYLHDKHPEKDYYASKAPIVHKLLIESDCAWISTRKLALHLRPYCKKARVIENYINADQFQEKPARSPANDKFQILYMGTSSHKRDLALLLTALRELASQEFEFELNLIGINDHRLIEEWIKVIEPPAETFCQPNFMDWLKTLDNFDLGISPLEKTTFNECKSDIKFWDYTMMGLPILASNIMTYNSTIKSGKNGLLADNSVDDWIEKIMWAANNREQLRILAANAANDLKGLAFKRAAELKRQSSLQSLSDFSKVRSQM